MSGILRLESLTKGNTLKQGDKTPLKYRLFDADGEKLNIAGKSAQVRLVYPDFLTIGYEKDGLTVAQDDTVTFTIDGVIPSRIYHVEIIVDDKFIFPSRADEAKFTVDKSSLGAESNIIEVIGKDILVRDIMQRVDTELQPLVTSLESAQQAEAQRASAEAQREIDHANRSAELASKADKFVLNNEETNGDFSEGTDTTATGFAPQENTTNPRLVNGVQYWTGSTLGHSGSLLGYNSYLNSGDMYYLSVLTDNVGAIYTDGLTLNINEDGLQSTTFALDIDRGVISFRVRTINQESSISNLQVINLTESFGAGNEPTKEFMDELISQHGYFDEYVFDEKWQVSKLIELEDFKSNIPDNPDEPDTPAIIEDESITLNKLTKDLQDKITTPAIIEDESIALDKLTKDLQDKIIFSLKNIEKNGDFSEGTDTVATGFLTQSSTTNPRLVDGVQYWTGSTTSSSGALLAHSFDLNSGDTYYINVITDNVAIVYANKLLINTFNVDGLHSATFVLDTEYSGITFRVREINQESSVSKLQLINLTESFGAGNEPTKEFMDDLIAELGYFDEFVFDEKWQVDKLFKLESAKAEKSEVENPEIVNVLNNPDFSTGVVGGGWALSAGATVASGYPKGLEAAVVPLVSLGYGGIYQSVGAGLKYARFEFFNNGGLTHVTVGDNITIPVDIPLDSWGSVSIITDFSGTFRFYLHQSDITKINILRKPFVVNLTEEFGAGNEPSKEIMDEIYDGSVHAIRLKNTLDHYILADKVNRLEKSGVGSVDPQTLYNTDMLKKNINSLIADNNFLLTNIQSTADARLDKTIDQQTVTVRDSSENQKLLLHLHKRENDGYDTDSDVYLPNAENDFSDVKIIDNVGNALPYTVKYYTDDFDVVADKRLGMNNGSKAVVNSHGTIFQKVNNQLSTSTDNGRTWTALPVFSDILGPYFNFISQDDTIYLTRDGNLYRSEYPYTERTQVLNVSDGYGGSPLIHTNSFVQHPDGELFTASYQGEWHIRIFKSTDNGLTWTLCLDNNDYQHVHSMHIDTSVSPVAIYAGVDGGGGVYKSTDKGLTWVDLRATNPSMPFSTDFGVVYSDPSGYRLLGGETSITGGHSIIKTVNDIDFYPVLSAGSGVACARKLNNLLFAGGAGANAFKNATLFMSRDEGETWEGVYTTGVITDTPGANDGYRYLSNIGDEIYVSTQSQSRGPLRILSDGIYAEIIVEVPAGVESLSVANGYASNNRKLIDNDTEYIGEKLVYMPLNEGGRIIKETVTDKYFIDDFEWDIGGKHLSGLYPEITSVVDSESIKLDSLIGFDISAEHIDSSSGLTISFWGRFNQGTFVDLISVGDTKLRTVNHQLHYNGTNRIVWNYPLTVGAFNKYDIVIDGNGNATTYVNGRSRFEATAVFEDFLSDINAVDTVKLLNTSTADVDTAIQHFTIRKGVVGSEVIYDEYHAGVKDNLGS